MTNNDYSIDELIKTFTEHADHYDECEKAHPSPYGPFSISRALLHICQEIKQLKEACEDFTS